MMEGGVWEVPPCCPSVQGGRCGPLCLYGVSLDVSVMGDEDLGGRQLIHLCGVGEVVGDSDLGGVVFAGGGVGDNVVGRPCVPWGVFCSVQFEWVVERLWRRGSSLGFCVRRYFGLDQVLFGSRAPGPQPGWLPLSQPGGGRWFWCLGGGGWFGDEGVVVLICPPHGVAWLGVAVWGLGLGLLDG